MLVYFHRKVSIIRQFSEQILLIIRGSFSNHNYSWLALIFFVNSIVTVSEQ